MALEIERRFLVRPGFSEKHLPMSLVTKELSVWQAYLKKISKGSGSRRIRMVFDRRKNIVKYFYTEKQSTDDPAVRIENEREISKEECDALKSEMDPNRDAINKSRYCFRYKNQDFELDFFSAPMRADGLVILEIEMDRSDSRVELPDFIPIVAEITGCLSNSDIAKRL